MRDSSSTPKLRSRERSFPASRKRPPSIAVTVIAILDFVLGGLTFFLSCYGLIKLAHLIKIEAPGPTASGPSGIIANIMGVVALLVWISLLAHSFLGLVIGVLMVIAGWGVITRRAWGRIGTMVLSSLFVVPVLVYSRFVVPMLVDARIAKKAGILIPLTAVSYAVGVFVVLLNRRYAAEFRRRKHSPK